VALLLPIARHPLLRRNVVFYFAPLLLTVAAYLAINYSIHNSIVPVQIVRSYFEYPGSPWIGSDQLSGMRRCRRLQSLVAAALQRGLFRHKYQTVRRPPASIAGWC
jgi:hypothetical protein